MEKEWLIAEVKFYVDHLRTMMLDAGADDLELDMLAHLQDKIVKRILQRPENEFSPEYTRKVFGVLDEVKANIENDHWPLVGGNVETAYLELL